MGIEEYKQKMNLTDADFGWLCVYAGNPFCDFAGGILQADPRQAAV